MGLLDACGEVQKDVSQRAARLYRFNKRRYAALTRQGFLFEIREAVGIRRFHPLSSFRT